MSSSSFSFHCARFPDDAVSIVQIVGAVWHGGGAAIVEAQYGQVGSGPWQRYQAEDVLTWLKSDHASSYIVRDDASDGQVAGFCSFQIDRARDTATVGYNAVCPTYQGRGLGNLMMRYVMDRIRENGVGYAAVLVADNDNHLPARRVYEKAGFQTVYSLRYMFQKLS